MTDQEYLESLDVAKLTRKTSRWIYAIEADVTRHLENDMEEFRDLLESAGSPDGRALSKTLRVGARVELSRQLYRMVSAALDSAGLPAEASRADAREARIARETANVRRAAS